VQRVGRFGGGVVREQVQKAGASREHVNGGDRSSQRVAVQGIQIVDAPAAVPPPILHGTEDGKTQPTQWSLTQQQGKVVAQQILQDTSRYALRPPDPEAFAGMVQRVFQIAQKGQVSSTTDMGHWRKWQRVTDRLGTPAFRGDVAAHSGADAAGYFREACLQAVALIEIYKEMRPKDKSKAKAKPQSALNVLLAVRRVHERHMVRMVPGRFVNQVLRGMMREFVEECGAVELLPQRKEPLEHWHIRRLATIPDGTKVGARQVDGSQRFWASVKAMVEVLSQTGFRKDEVSVPRKDARPRLTRASITYFYKGEYRSWLTLPELTLMSDGDCVVLTPPSSKADPFGLVWSTQPIYLPFRALDQVPVMMPICRRVAGACLFLSCL